MNDIWMHPPVLGVAAFSGSGKTTLLSAVLPLLVERALRIGVVKHSHHDFEIDQPGKDSHRLRRSGACQTLIASPWRTAWIRENAVPQEPVLEELICRLQRDALDLVLVEGFRHENFPKIEIHRGGSGKPLLHAQDPHIIALACDKPIKTPLPTLDLNNPAEVAEFIFSYVQSSRTGAAS